jgi:Na+-transporting methylmalonyl-CoA/oxaloacetate decarboxylase gamma subunit
MAGGKSSADSYWPGFVDALTNVVIAMIFVVVVLAISLAFAAQLMGKKIAERIIKEHEAKTGQVTKAPSSSEVDQKAPESIVPDRVRIPVAASEAVAKPGGGKLREARNVLQLDFAPNAITLDESATKAFKAAVDQAGGSGRSKRVQLVGRGPAMQLSDNQRNAYLRVMATRNVLIESGYPAELISVRIDTETDAPDASVSVSFLE